MMKNYTIPNTDGACLLTKKLKFNYQRYRTLLHFIFLNKDYFEITEKKVRATDFYAVKECGKIVYKTVNLTFNLDHWVKLWDEISEDDIFQYHVKEIGATDNILDFLNGIIPCGMTRRLHNVVQFGESLKKCLKTSSKKNNIRNSNLQTDREIINAWMKELELGGPENFKISPEIYEISQKYAIGRESPNFQFDLEEIIKNIKGQGVLRPYIWATIIEEVYNAEIILPEYAMHPILKNAYLKQRVPMNSVNDELAKDTSNKATKDPANTRKRKINRDRSSISSKQKESFEYEQILRNFTVESASPETVIAPIDAVNVNIISEQKNNIKKNLDENINSDNSIEDTENMKESSLVNMSLLEKCKSTWKELENRIKKEKEEIISSKSEEIDINHLLHEENKEIETERKININLPEGMNFNTSRQPRVVLVREVPKKKKKGYIEIRRNRIEEENSVEEKEKGEENEKEEDEEEDKIEKSRLRRQLRNKVLGESTSGYSPIIPFPIMPGMKIEGLKFKVNIKSISFETKMENKLHYSSNSQLIQEKKNLISRQRSNSNVKKAQKKRKNPDE